ncbi:hypothetical protein HD806DRAFT_536088 [Xylariaceae sp. AK1471]|nr:hypothetical protein HD806DRAFT_536088 [Xylariaceae sp. AK1471]
MKSTKILLALPAAWALSPAYTPGLCISSPVLQLNAGCSVVSAVVEDELDRRCIAILSFGNDDFLPVSYSFEPLPCLGQQIASFHIPTDAPNGDAYITWQCSGHVSTCSHANITGGLENPSMKLQHLGTVGCILEALQTSTTLVTVTRSSTTVTTSLPTIFTKTDTSFPMLSATITVSRLQTTTGSLSSSVQGSDNAGRKGSTPATTSVGSVTDGIGTSRETTPATGTTTKDPRLVSAPSGSASASQVDAVLLDSSGSKTATLCVPAIITSLVSTMTVIHTVTACSMRE